jgi:hypothetical protein
VHLGNRVLIEHHPLGRGSVGGLHPLQADGGREAATAVDYLVDAADPQHPARPRR